MSDDLSPAEPTASSLKKELAESLEVLKKDFASLMHFVEEIAPEGVPAPIPLTKEELEDLLSATLAIQDAGNDIAFEAGKIKEKLERLG
jgi:hypothetical protein